MLRKLKGLRLTKEENYIRDCTADNGSTPSDELKEKIAKATFGDNYEKMLAMLVKRMVDFPKIKHVHKALLLIQYGLTHFCDRFPNDMNQHVSTIQRITKYRYYLQGEEDIAAPVRKTASLIIQQLSKEEELEETRKKEVEQVKKAAEKDEKSEEKKKEDDTVEVQEEETDNKDVDMTKYFDAFAQNSIKVSGRSGCNSGRINGVYEPGEDKIGGRVCFKRGGGSVGKDDDPIYLHYYAKRKLWMISRKSHIGGESAYACCKGEKFEDPTTIKDTKWMVWDTTLNKYVEDTNITISKM